MKDFRLWSFSITGLRNELQIWQQANLPGRCGSGGVRGRLQINSARKKRQKTGRFRDFSPRCREGEVAVRKDTGKEADLVAY